MSSSPVSLGNPPAAAPQVASQMGGLSGVTSMLANRGSQPGAPPQSGAPGGSPGGDLAVQGEAVKRVVLQMSKNDQFAPYGKRIMDILTAGLQAASGPQPGSPQAGASASDGTSQFPG